MFYVILDLSNLTIHNLHYLTKSQFLHQISCRIPNDEIKFTVLNAIFETQDDWFEKKFNIQKLKSGDFYLHAHFCKWYEK